MTKRLQNKIAGSKLTLPVVSLYAIVIWIAGGLLANSWWPQFVCFAATAYLMMVLNNHYALIHIFSRMVSVSFLTLSCCATFLFPSLSGAAMQLCLAAFIVILFSTYQDQQSSGRAYYAFLCFGLATMVFPKVLWLLPLLWVLMYFYLMCLSWRTWTASLLGLLTPYWFAACWWLYQEDTSFITILWDAVHDLHITTSLATLSAMPLSLYVFLVVLTAIGTTHFIRKSYNEKIRTRMFYGFLVWIDLAATLLLALQPQHYDYWVRLMVITTAPIIAHYLALTATRWTNIVFLVLTATALLLTAISLWSTSSPF